MLDALYLLDTYHNGVRAGHAEAFRPPAVAAAPDPVLDGLLETSKGVLLWRWQLESLCACFMPGPVEANAFARRLNMKLAETWAEADRLTLPSSQSFGKAVWQRMAYGGGVPGHWRSAARLLTA